MVTGGRLLVYSCVTVPKTKMVMLGKWRGRSYKLLTGLLNSGHEAHQRQLRGDLHGGRRGRKRAD